MLLSPRKTKYRKQQKKKPFKSVYGSSYMFAGLNHGVIGLKALEPGRLKSKQIQSVRNVINKKIKKIGRLKVNVFPHIPITKKPIEVRMGKGKGNVDHWVFNVKAGFMLYEIETNSMPTAIKALELGQRRIPFKTRIIFD
jgi:large subunit ribosomal protein L16